MKTRNAEKKRIKCGRKQMKIYFDYARAKKERAVLIEIKKKKKLNEKKMLK